ncbi:DNA-binding GntR family transcriptional regulator [Sinorhizobium kostiense]|uniref:DNA-binding GntR family transcriptional regulator n=1 Tax=Sinorhizobium kostiense TaxID=76747 RepID=A0ABS4QSL0_9HYPH|nr:GntR family transcriptional regulator [Sinorhizobium kostiense]MBP2233637.1 DNA-binding GntR family transcriptional regulator [Sinorhizobium kostiense]
MADQVQIRAVELSRAPSVTEQVFEHLYHQVVELDLPPGTKLSEVEVAKILGVSRQPVRDAFYRLSQLGFLLIRPQRATVVTHISEKEVMQARFIRTALEMETVRAAADCLTEAQLDRLDALLVEQEKAIAAEDKVLFHALDDSFHKLICELSGHEFAWALIRDSKAHMDRVRYLSLSFGAQSAFDDHKVIMAALREHDGAKAADAMRVHLSRIKSIIGRIRESHGSFFTEGER